MLKTYIVKKTLIRDPKRQLLAEKAFEEDQQTKSETPQKIHSQDVQCGEIYL